MPDRDDQTGAENLTTVEPADYPAVEAQDFPGTGEPPPAPTVLEDEELRDA